MSDPKKKDDLVDALLDIMIPVKKEKLLPHRPDWWSKGPDEKSDIDMLKELMTLVKGMMPAPKPLSKAEERLYELSLSMGWKPIVAPVFKIDATTKTLEVEPWDHPEHRVLAIAHELGHARRRNAGLVNEKALTRSGDPKKWSEKIKYEVLREEILAWREGMKILRELGIRFKSKVFVRKHRKDILNTYRIHTMQYSKTTKNIKFLEDK